jgi:hypothetical protein
MMKKHIAFYLLLVASLVVTNSAFALKVKTEENMPFYVYTDNNSPKNHFIPSGWMGDYGAVKINQACRENPYSGDTCIQINYTGEPTQGSGWVGAFWQNPENNWGTKDGGFNLSKAKKVSIMAKGAEGGEMLEFKIGGITGQFSDSDTVGIGPIALTDQWKEYTIDLSGAELFYISGGFVFAASRMDNQDGFVVYLDEIKYE